jgi:NTE family protein
VERAPSRIHLPPYETIALMLQGGGALGAYQAGVYQGLHEADIHPNWIAGISIGSLNTAIIAGNAPEHRVTRLLEFWETICQPAYGFPLPAFVERALFDSADEIRKAFTAMQAFGAVVEGQKGFFVPRFPPPSPIASNSPQTASYYDTTPLKATLERLCDFDRINSGETRVSVGAVNVATGNFAYFDNTQVELRAEHFIASGALPPGFAAVEIDGQFYWDGAGNAAAGHARLPGRSVERARAGAGQHRRCHGTREGRAVFEPHAPRHGSDAALAALPQCPAARARPRARRGSQE